RRGQAREGAPRRARRRAKHAGVLCPPAGRVPSSAEGRPVTELTWILDPASGELAVEGITAEEASARAGDLLPPPRDVNCARPLTMAPLPASGGPSAPSVRVARIYHGSVVDGPGRRSVCQFQGCARACTFFIYGVPDLCWKGIDIG